MHEPISMRIKEFTSLINKVIGDIKYHKEPLLKINDILGLRVMLYFESDLEKVCDIIEEEFEVIGTRDDKRERLEPDQFGYSSIHYIVKLDERRLLLPEYKDYKDLKAEVQIRTIVEHPWDVISHYMDYKPKELGSSLSPKLERRLNSLMALFEIANREFDSIHKEYNEQIGKPVEELNIEKIKQSFNEIIKNEALFDAIAIIFQEKKQYQNLLDFADLALKLNSNYKIALYYKGVSLHKLKRHEEAIKLFDKTLEIDPNDIAALGNKGISLSRLKRYEEANELIDIVIRIDPENANANYNKACFESLKNKKESSLKFLRKAIKLDEKFKKIAKEDEDFYNIRNSEEFKQLIS